MNKEVKKTPMVYYGKHVVFNKEDEATITQLSKNRLLFIHSPIKKEIMHDRI